MARNDAHENVSTSAWEAELNSQSTSWYGIVAAAADNEAPVKQESYQIETIAKVKKMWSKKKSFLQ